MFFINILNSKNIAILSIHTMMNNEIYTMHCLKSVQIRTFFWSEYKKIRTRKNSVFGHVSRSDDD